MASEGVVAEEEAAVEEAAVEEEWHRYLQAWSTGYTTRSIGNVVVERRIARASVKQRVKPRRWLTHRKLCPATATGR